MSMSNEKSSKCWTESLMMTPIPTDSISSPDDGNITIDVVTFNILAQAFATPRSHICLPSTYADVAFDPPKRKALLLLTLNKLVQKIHPSIDGNSCSEASTDFLCLQELDGALFDSVTEYMKELGYEYVFSPRDKVRNKVYNRNNHDSKKGESKDDDEGGHGNNLKLNDKKTNNGLDGCAIFFNIKKWKCIKNETITFDDLADEKRIPLHLDLPESMNHIHEESHNTNLGTHYINDIVLTEEQKNRQFKTPRKAPVNALTGVGLAYRRRNTALMLLLQRLPSVSEQNNKEKDQEQDDIIVCVTCAHLYWNPDYEYVKLSQAKYWLHKLDKFATIFNNDYNVNTKKVNRLTTEGDLNIKFNGTSKIGENINNASISSRYPVIVCGDLNSKPNSAVIDFFTAGKVDARTVAPWHYFYNEKEERDDKISEKNYSRVNVENIDNSTLSSSKNINGVNSSESKRKEILSIHNHDKQRGKSNEMDAFFKKMQTLDVNDTPQCYPISTSSKTQMYSDSGNPTKNNLQITNTDKSVPSVHFLLDMTLNKLARWLRILGIDALLETEEEERARTRDGDMILFDRCKNEKRTLITTSSKLLQRKNCPPGAYLLNSMRLLSLEISLVHILKFYGITLQPRKFLTRCVVCNGKILELSKVEEKRKVLQQYGSSNIEEDLENVYQCNGCGQGYWWSDSPTSSASRVKNAATHLFRLCLRGNIPIEGCLRLFDHVSVKEERQIGKIKTDLNNKRNCDSINGVEEVVSWLREEELIHDFDLKSAYVDSLAFTNVTSEFVGTLDYIFYERNDFKVQRLLNIPKTLLELNEKKIVNGHLLPSDVWPSDHLAVAARLQLINKQETVHEMSSTIASFKPSNHSNITKPNPVVLATSTSIEKPHELKCACGCVPQILSLFEMAELRKQARLASQKSKLDKL